MPLSIYDKRNANEAFRAWCRRSEQTATILNLLIWLETEPDGQAVLRKMAEGLPKDEP